MKKAVVLSGGGAKGAYEIGVWKALRKIGYKYDIVTGTSVGALNGAFMVMNDYKNAVSLWENISPKDIFDEQFSHEVNTIEDKKDILLHYAKKATQGGFSVQALEKNIERLLDASKFFNSSINYGLVTFNLSTLKPMELEKKDLAKENLKDYLVASATCFPAFQIKEINKEQFIDGGYYDNMPVNLAIKLGAKDIIAVNLDAIGIQRKVKNNTVKITYIKPRNDIGSFIIFNKKNAKRAIQYGFNDTMKTFGKYVGKQYTFKKSIFSNNYRKYIKKYTKKLYEITEKKDTFVFEQLYIMFRGDKLKKDSYEKAIQSIEEIGYIFELDDVEIYSFFSFNYLLKQKINSIKKIDKQEIEDMIEHEWKQIFDKKMMIKYIYDKIKNKEYDNFKKIALLFPKEFVAAIYLSII